MGILRNRSAVMVRNDSAIIMLTGFRNSVDGVLDALSTVHTVDAFPVVTDGQIDFLRDYTLAYQIEDQ